MNHSERVKNAVNIAEKKFLDGFNCAEASLAGTADSMGLPDYPPGVATGFGGGVGRCGSLCGALAGGVIALSLKFNRSSPEDKAEYALIMEATEELLNKFKETFKDIDCPPLAGYDLRLVDERKKFAKDPKRKEKCAAYVREAARLSAEIIEKLEYKGK